MIDTPDPIVNDPQNSTGLPSSRIDDISLTLYFSATSGEEDLHVTEGYVHATHTFQGDMPYPHILSQLRKDYDYSFEGTCEPAAHDQFVFKVSGRTHLVRSPEVIHSLLVTALAQVDTQLRAKRAQEQPVTEKKPEEKEDWLHAYPEEVEPSQQPPVSIMLPEELSHHELSFTDPYEQYLYNAYITGTSIAHKGSTYLISKVTINTKEHRILSMMVRELESGSYGYAQEWKNQEWKPEEKGIAPDSYYSYHQNLMSAIELEVKP